MKVVVATDVWPPFVSGVVRTFMTTIERLAGLGHETRVISPDQFRTVACPTYPQLRLARGAGPIVQEILNECDADAVHVATEGPIGLAARNWCVRHKFPFTTSYTTKFPEYLQARFGIPAACSYPAFRWFHRPSAGIMVASESLASELAARGFGNLQRWSRGVDTDLFRPRDKSFLDLPRPVSLYAGRVAVEKNISAFLDLDLPGTKVVVGDGPQLEQLRRRYPAARFTGALHGEDLAKHYAAADVLVFPSRTDTFGLVILEALASGVPVAALPVTGPLDAIGKAEVGVLHEDLGAAVRQALLLDPQKCRRHAERFSWDAVAKQFVNNLVTPTLVPEPVMPRYVGRPSFPPSRRRVA